MTRGYVRLWRKTIDDAVFQDARLFKVFTWCLLKATHKVISIPVSTGRGQTIVTLDPGQLIFGRHSASRELEMPPSSIRDRLERLRRLQILDIKPDTHYSIITVINWQSYQADDNEEGQATRQATDTQPTQTKTIRTKKTYGDFVLLTDDEYQKLVQEFGEQGTKGRIEALNDGIGSKGYKYKSHYHTILTWERKNKKPEVQKPLGGLAY